MTRAGRSVGTASRAREGLAPGIQEVLLSSGKTSCRQNEEGEECELGEFATRLGHSGGSSLWVTVVDGHCFLGTWGNRIYRLPKTEAIADRIAELFTARVLRMGHKDTSRYRRADEK